MDISIGLDASYSIKIVWVFYNRTKKIQSFLTDVFFSLKLNYQNIFKCEFSNFFFHEARDE